MLTRKGILILLVATALVVFAAVVSRQSEQSSSIPTQDAYFPDLLNQSNQVAKVIIKDNNATTTIKKDGNQWAIAEKDDYPASTAKVRELILGMARLRRMEAKTKNPDLYDKLDVNDISEPGSNSKFIQMISDSGEDLAVLIVGKDKPTQGGVTKRQVYVRTPGNAQSWLVEGLIPTLGDSTDWIDKAIITPDVGEIRSVTVSSAGDSLVITRENPDTMDFTLQELGPDEEIESQYAVNQIAQSFKDLRLEDVKSESNVDLRTAENSRAVLESFDGVQIELDIHKQGEEVFGQLHAAYKETTESDEETKPIPETVKQWNELWKNWIYVLPNYQVENIIVRKEDLIKQEPVEETKEQDSKDIN